MGRWGMSEEVGLVTALPPEGAAPLARGSARAPPAARCARNALLEHETLDEPAAVHAAPVQIRAFPQLIAAFATTIPTAEAVSVRGMMPHLHLAPPPAGAAPSPRPEPPPIRVVLADDHAVVRRSLRLLLDGEEGVEVVAEAGDLSAVARHVHSHLPHVLVLDLQMPNGSSIELLRRLRAQAPDTEVVVLTMQQNPAFAQQAIDAGAVGFVLKEQADVELPAAVRRAARGEEYISPRVAAALDALRRAIGDDGLSPRDTEVLRLIALGHTSAEIARMLHLSRRTVETRRARIHQKLGLRTRAELVGYALERHLIGA